MRIVLLLVLAGAALGGDDDVRATFRKELLRIYDYLPADVDAATRNAKSAEMDRFWELVASQPAICLPLLRDELRKKDQNAFFLFDGSALLVKQSKDKADLELAVDAVSRCRLKDVSDEGYFYFVHRLCKEDVDAFPAVAKILEEPEYRFYLVQHALWMKQFDCVMLCLYCLGEERWVARMIQRLGVEKDGVATETILASLSFAATPEADAAIRAYAAREDLPKELKECATDLLLSLARPDLPKRDVTSKRADFDAFLKACEAGRMPALGPGDAMMLDAPYLVTKEDIPRIRAARRMIARRVSDEAMLELGYLTDLLRFAQAKR